MSVVSFQAAWVICRLVNYNVARSVYVIYRVRADAVQQIVVFDATVVERPAVERIERERSDLFRHKRIQLVRIRAVLDPVQFKSYGKQAAVVMCIESCPAGHLPA